MNISYKYLQLILSTFFTVSSVFGQIAIYTSNDTFTVSMSLPPVIEFGPTKERVLINTEIRTDSVVVKKYGSLRDSHDSSYLVDSIVVELPSNVKKIRIRPEYSKIFVNGVDYNWIPRTDLKASYEFDVVRLDKTYIILCSVIYINTEKPYSLLYLVKHEFY